MNYQPITTQQSSSSMELASVITGIVGLLLCFMPLFGLISPCLAIMFALLSRGYEMKIKGQRLAGLLLGIIGVIGNVIFFVIIITAIINMVFQTADPSIINGYL